MKKVFFGLFFALTIIFAFGASCSNNNSATTDETIATNTVEIKNSTFSPETVTITRGGVITWENKDAQDHQIVSDGNLEGFESGVISNGDNFSFTFNDTGSFPYHCELHPEMKGIIIVK